MKPDRYTKTVLTIIAGALVWLCVRDVVRPVPVYAGAGQFSQSFDARSPLPVKIVGIERTRWTDRTVPFEHDAVPRALGWETIMVNDGH